MINIAELLKDCPKGMELDCLMYENVTLIQVQEENDYPIEIETPNGRMLLSKYGCFNFDCSAKCIIFPKGKTTWKGFKPPCKFKDGDVISNGWCVAIFHKIGKPCSCFGKDELYYHCRYHPKYNEFKGKIDYGIGFIEDYKYATEKEKEKLFQVIKENGYKWNPETKTLDKLVEPKFKVGDRIKKKGDTRLTTIKDIKDNYYIITIPDFFGNAYITDKLLFSNQDEYKIIPNKFDITTLIPFESKVLARDSKNGKWIPTYWGFYDKDSDYFPYKVIIGRYSYCIPYEGNEHLLGTANDCDEYYKTWK